VFLPFITATVRHGKGTPAGTPKNFELSPVGFFLYRGAKNVRLRLLISVGTITS
jgi:hypothetical protein